MTGCLAAPLPSLFAAHIGPELLHRAWHVAKRQNRRFWPPFHPPHPIGLIWGIVLQCVTGCLQFLLMKPQLYLSKEYNIAQLLPASYLGLVSCRDK